MILDSLDNAETYLAAIPKLAQAVAFARTITADSPTGRTELSDLGGFAVLMEYETEPAENRKLETHRRFVDLQLILKGRERMEWARAKGLQLSEEYDEAKDIAFWHGVGEADLTVTPGTFVVFLPEDAHKPNCSVDGPETVKKLVVKIPV